MYGGHIVVQYYEMSLVDTTQQIGFSLYSKQPACCTREDASVISGHSYIGRRGATSRIPYHKSPNIGHEVDDVFFVRRDSHANDPLLREIVWWPTVRPPSGSRVSRPYVPLTLFRSASKWTTHCTVRI